MSCGQGQQRTLTTGTRPAGTVPEDAGVGDVYAFLAPVQLHDCEKAVHPADESRLDQVITQIHRHSLAAPLRPATVMVTMDALTGKG